MLCQNCNENQATVFVHRIINGQERELHLCEECAKHFGMQLSFDELFQGFLDGFLSHSHRQSFGQENLMKTRVCDKCGFSYDDFKNSGKLGCGECYKVFHDDLSLVLKNIQGSVKHVGKVPVKNIAKVSFENKIARLENDLRRAINEEKYEDAARIRDEIKKIREAGNLNE